MGYEIQQVVDWLPKATIYEVNIRQYTSEGTFAAFQKHLPRLQEMGITVLWLMPIQPIGLRNRKGTLGSYYSIQDYKKINPEFGSLQDFKNLIDEAHKLGLKIIIDWVANHTSWDHVWVQEHPEFYATNADGQMYAPYDWTDVVQLNHDNTAQQKAMLEAMQYWISETNIDGFRCDMAHLTPLNFWKKARFYCDLKKPLLWLAETEDKSYFEAFDLLYGWEWLHKMEDYYLGKTDIVGLQHSINEFSNDAANQKYRILFTSNHDENSWQDSEYKRLGVAAKIFAVLCATLPGVPLIYSGQEEPVTRKLDFFNKDRIDFHKYEMASFYKALFDSKKTNAALEVSNNSSFTYLHTTATDKLLVFLREKDNQSILVIANLSNDNPLSFTITDDRLHGKYKSIFGEQEQDFDLKKSFFINAWDYAVYEKAQ